MNENKDKLANQIYLQAKDLINKIKASHGLNLHQINDCIADTTLRLLSKIENEIYKAIIMGYKYEEIADNLNVSKVLVYGLPGKIKDIIDGNDLKPHGHFKDDGWIDKELLQLRESGLTYKEISKQTGITIHMIKYNTSPEYRYQMLKLQQKHRKKKKIT